jgi:hypothetical protein
VNAHLVCTTCTGSAPVDAVHCLSLDCPWFYARRKAEAETELMPVLEELLEELVYREPEIEKPIEVYDSDYASPTGSNIYVEDAMED